MKKVTKLAMFLLAGTLATGFVSCSSDDDEVSGDLGEYEIISNNAIVKRIRNEQQVFCHSAYL